MSPPQANGHPTPRSPSECRVLLVVADGRLREALLGALRNQGYVVRGVESGQAALGLLREEPAECLVLDTQLPDLSPDMLVEQLREGGRATPFVVLSRGVSEGMAVRLMRLGAFDYLLADQGKIVPRLVMALRRLSASSPAAALTEPTSAELAAAEEPTSALATAAPAANSGSHLLPERIVRRGAERLQDKDHLFHLLAENARDVVFHLRFRPRPTMEYISPAVEAITGFATEHFYRDPFQVIRAIYKHDRLRVLDLLRRPEVFHTPLEIRWTHRDGHMIWMEQRAVPVFDEDGKLLALEGISRDVTERKRAEAELKNERRFLKQLLEIQERDRQLVAYEIHDGLVQHVTGALMHLEVFARKAPAGDENRKEFDQALRLLRSTIAEARSLISGLRPPILDEAGIVTAIEYLVNETRERAEIGIEFHYDVSFEELPPPLENALFRITQEALTNIARHSQAPAAYVELHQLDEFLQLRIQDWGVGFDPEKVNSRRYGLQGIRERARLFGGQATLESAPGRGTLITVQLPMVLSGSSAP